MPRDPVTDQPVREGEMQQQKRKRRPSETAPKNWREQKDDLDVVSGAKWRRCVFGVERRPSWLARCIARPSSINIADRHRYRQQQRLHPPRRHAVSRLRRPAHARASPSCSSHVASSSENSSAGWHRRWAAPSSSSAVYRPTATHLAGDEANRPMPYNGIKALATRITPKTAAAP